MSYLLERTRASTDPARNRQKDNLGRVEDGLQDVLRHLEAPARQFVGLLPTTAANSAYTPPPIDTAIVDIVKRELSDIRFSQGETDRRTQDGLETVHTTLGHIVDRLGMTRGDLRERHPRP